MRKCCFSSILFLILCFIGMNFQSTSKAQVRKNGIDSRDLKVERALKSIKFPFSVRDQGIYEVRYNYTDVNRHQVGFISSKTEFYEGYETRDVWSTIYEGGKPLEPWQMRKLLECTAKFGGWRIIQLNDKYLLCFIAQIPANSSATVLKSTIKLVLGQADTIEHEIFGKDDF